MKNHDSPDNKVNEKEAKNKDEKKEETKKTNEDIEQPEDRAEKIIEEVLEPEKRKPYTKKTLIILTIIPLIALALILNSMAEDTITKQKYEIIKNDNITTITTRIPENITYSEFLNNLERYNRKEISLKGRLRTDVYKRKLIGIYDYFSVDDNNNTMGLDEIGDFDTLFPENGTTEDIFIITGTFQRDDEKMRITVTRIMPVVRIYTTNTTVINMPYTENMTTTYTEPKHPTIRKIIYSIKGKDQDQKSVI